jgi:hypothetical protein
MALVLRLEFEDPMLYYYIKSTEEKLFDEFHYEEEIVEGSDSDFDEEEERKKIPQINLTSIVHDKGGGKFELLYMSPWTDKRDFGIYADQMVREVKEVGSVEIQGRSKLQIGDKFSDFIIRIRYGAVMHNTCDYRTMLELISSRNPRNFWTTVGLVRDREGKYRPASEVMYEKE